VCLSIPPFSDSEAWRRPLRVPFYVQPRLYSQLEIEADGTIPDPETDLATIQMTHQGPITSSLWLYPALMWNDAPDPTMTGPADVRLFGMDYGRTDPDYGDVIAVAINTWDYWHVPQPFFAEFHLYIDADQDGERDYLNFNWDYGAATGADYDNAWAVIQVDLATGDLYLGSPYLIVADYNGSLMEWYLPAGWQGLGPGNATFDYQLVGYDQDGMSVSPPGRFDYVNCPLDWGISQEPGPADDEAMMVVVIADVDGYRYSQTQGVMAVDDHGDPRNVNGGQACFVPMKVGGEVIYLPLIVRTAAP